MDLERTLTYLKLVHAAKRVTIMKMADVDGIIIMRELKQ